MNVYVKGNLVRVSASFTNEAGAALDPTVVKCVVLEPGDVLATTYTYGTDVAVVKDSTGHYHLDIDADEAGEWRYRWYSTGTGQSASEGLFMAVTAFP
jgi:hypothetical protein